MRRFRDLPIGRKVTLLIVLASAAALGLATAAVIVFEISTIEPRAEAELESQADLLRANTEAALAFDDSRAATENLATLQSRPEIEAAALYDAEGELFAAYRRATDFHLLLPARAPPGLSGRQGPHLRVSRYVTAEGERLGTLVLWHELPPLWVRLQDYAIAASLVAFALGLVSAILLLLLRSSVSTPLLALADAARAVTDRRDYNLRVPKHADDELGTLTDAFNGMLAAIERSDRALQQNAAQLSDAMEAARMASWSYDPASDALAWGGAEARLFGSGVAPQTASLAAFAAIIASEDQERVRRRLAAAAREGGALELDFRTRGPDGRPRWFTMRGRTVEGAEGRRLVGLVQDVTERRHLQEQLQQSQKMEAIGRLAGGIAHDFNNLLTAILGYARFALNRLPPGDPIAADVGEIHRAGERAATLTQQLLAYSRRQMLQPVVLDVNETVTNLASLLGRLLGEHIELVLSLQPGTGSILADRASLEQVVVNLAVNARDAMPTGGRLTIATEPAELGGARPEPLAQLPVGAYVRLSVSDTGHGMDAETLAQVFEPFFTTKEVGKGTGLGLAMVFGTVSQSGGGVTVASAPGQGASFSLYFPRVSALALNAPVVVPPVEGGRETILLVEDEPAVLELAARGLTERGYTVVATSAPAQAEAWAVGRARDGKPAADLLITDVVMPEMSGPELAERLGERWPGLRVLFVSGYTDDAVVAHGLIESTVDFLPKPFAPDELARRVRRALDDPKPRTSRPMRIAAD